MFVNVVHQWAPPSVNKVFTKLLTGKSHNRTERDSQGVGRDILISKKLFLELCGPCENSFRLPCRLPMKQYTSGRLAFIQKKWRPKWSNMSLMWLNYPASAKNIITKANGKNFYLIGSFKISGKIQPPRETFLLELKIGEQDWLSRGGRSSKTRVSTLF